MTRDLIRKIKNLVIGGGSDPGWVYDKATTDEKLDTKPTAALVTDISNSSTDAQVASAKAINNKLNNKSDISHDHSSLYYLQEDIDEMFRQMQQAQIDGEIDLSNYALRSHAHGNISNAGAIGSSANVPIITGANGVLIAGSFEGTASNIKMNGTQSVGTRNTFARGDHTHPVDTSRAAASHTHTKANITDFPTTMTPSSHAHGNIANAGTIGNTANLPLITTTNGKITTGSFGNGANTFCQGNDTRLSDARTPKSHAHGNISNAGSIGSSANVPIITGANGVLIAGSFEGTASNIKMNGTQAVGSLNTFARGDHVHPVDTSRAPNNHASSATTYGLGTTANYGHVKTVNSLTQSSHSDGTALSAYQGKVLNDKLTFAQIPGWGVSEGSNFVTGFYNELFVVIDINWAINTTTSLIVIDESIGNIPSGYRPAHDVSGLLYPLTEGIVQASGAVSVRRISGTGIYVRGQIIYKRG